MEEIALERTWLMKFVHLSDLHLGIRVNDFSMYEDQKYILERILNIIDKEKPDAVIIAGDIYDKSIPPAEAVVLFDNFITEIAKRKIKAFIISGNHDSAERIAFGSEIMKNDDIYFSPVYSGNVTPIKINDEYGSVFIYMLPFIRPSNVKEYYPDDDCSSYSSAVNTAVTHMNVNYSERNIIITHQFVTGAMRSDSEEVSVGGTDNVSAEIFKDFDYTALGHIHNPQNISSEKIRYCGTPLKYSFSEANTDKSVTVCELKEKGNLSVKTVNLIPLRDMKRIKGSYDELMSKNFYENTDLTNCYLEITLTDENDIPDAVVKLRGIYKYLMKLSYDNTRTRSESIPENYSDKREDDPEKLFDEFYNTQNGMPLDEDQKTILHDIIQKIWEEE